MAALNELHVYGEEFAQKWAWRQDQITRDTTIEVALFDADDTAAGITVTDTTDVGDLTTEPSDGNYTRQTATLDSSDFAISKNANGNWEIDVADQVFNTDGTTGIVNAAAVIGTFQSDEAGDTGASKHVLFTVDLSPERNLDGIVELTADQIRLELE